MCDVIRGAVVIYEVGASKEGLESEDNPEVLVRISRGEFLWSSLDLVVSGDLIIW